MSTAAKPLPLTISRRYGTRSLSLAIGADRLPEKVGATIKSVTEPLDTTNSMGVFVIQILGAVAQLERAMIRERSIAGQFAARERGRLPGRVRVLTPENEAALVKEYLQGRTTYAGLAHKFGVSESAAKRAVYRVTKSQEYVKRVKA